MKTKKKLLALSVGLAMPFLAIAQEDAGRLEKRFEKPPEPKSVPQPLVFPINEQLPPEQAGQVKLNLKSLTFSGNTAFTSDELSVLAADLLGKEITLLDIYRLRDAITKKYGDAGFGLSKAIVPEQRIQAEGMVQLQVIEGFVDEVIIEGGNDVQQEYLAYMGEKIKAERPLKASTLERYLLLANDRFAIKVTSTLRQSEKTPAASTLILKVEEAPKFDGGASIDNRGTKAVGKNQFNGDVSINGLLGRASKTTVGYATVEQGSELQYWSLNHTELLSNEGTALTFGYTNSLSKPGTTALRLLDQTSKSEGWSAKVSHPFIRTRQENLTAHVKYDQKDTESLSLNATTSFDKIRSVRIGLNYDNADAYEGINQALLEYSHGIQGLGSTDNNSPLKSRADGRPDYQKITINLSRKQELSYFSPMLSKFSVNAALMGQYSDRGLLSSEECGLGGQQFGRAYDASEIMGDSCMAGSLELRYTLNTQDTPFQYAQLYTFYDGGQTTNHTPLNATDKKSKSLTSSGLGVRYGLGKYMTGSVEYSKPMTRDVANENNRDARVFASIAVRF
ncbi:ShlB/FhaC/HecB family hemolysin secretion/activation protein [Dechloromonas sp. ZS-1]|uniref:ShlB/FhaC/HecB family hemolysin secretion/activation protein n=1 Tax=Dechloromonas sp. ZS-1 TaxID=3138067 RepID=UPI0031FE009A